MHKNE